jgi:hypothetical protein
LCGIRRVSSWLLHFKREANLTPTIGWSISSGRGHIYWLPSRASCIAKQPILCTFRAPELGVRALT